MPLRIEHVIRRHVRGPPCSVSPETMVELAAYRWPDSVRELESALRRRGKGRADGGAGEALVALKEIVREAEAAHIRRVLRASEGHRARAAEILGLSRKNLRERMNGYGIEQVDRPSTLPPRGVPEGFAPEGGGGAGSAVLIHAFQESRPDARRWGKPVLLGATLAQRHGASVGGGV